ncbi:MAG: tetratricopeptide repeat protein, partial [Sphaerospermopsis kisseleviana]
KGIALSELNQLQEAIQSFNTAEKLESSPGLYNNRALAYQRLGQLNKALEDLTKSVQLLPTPITRLNLSNLRIQLNQFQQVVNEMNQLIVTDKTFFPAYLTRGIAYYNLGQYET